jgi:hypothetical protein
VAQAPAPASKPPMTGLPPPAPLRRRRPPTWQECLPRLTRATLIAALTDALIVAEDCDDEPAQRRYLRILDSLERA